MSRKIVAFCVMLFLLFTCSCTVFAAEFDSSRVGSISVTLIEQKRNEPMVGAELSVYYVAAARLNASGSVSYVYTDAFEGADFAIDDASLLTKLDVYIARHDVPSVTITTDEDGTALCDALGLGLYFVKQTGTVEGFAPCTPFLVTVPCESEDGYVYEVNASPKTEVARLTSITIKKVWNTDATTEAADHVTVQLLRDGKVIQTATLNAQNDWQVTYTDMPESDAYSIKEINVPKGFTATYSQAGYVFTVTNTSTLIQTGQRVWPIPVLAAGGMLLIAVGIALLRKKGKSHA